MNKIVGIALIVVGILVLFYGAGTLETGAPDPELTSSEEIAADVEERAIPAGANLPIWGGLIAIAAGAGLLYVHKRNRDAGVEGLA